MTALLATFSALVGLAVGSFLNVIIHRVPREESVVHPRSRCPSCAAEIRGRDNVPVVSYVALKGRCRECAGRIGVRYVAVEVLTTVLFVALAIRLRAQPAALPAFLYFGGLGIALTFIDLDVRRLPNRLTLPAYPVSGVLLALAALAGGDWSDLVRAVAGGALLYAFYFLIVFVKPGGMGFGDVKLAGILGGYLGWLGWGSLAVGAFAGFLLGGVLSVALLATGRVSRKSKIPFGPFMIAGALLAIFIGEPIASAYLSLTTG
jgi:leader peptidase (prepilin peptidase)/N-methyltransferase